MSLFAVSSSRSSSLLGSSWPDQPDKRPALLLDDAQKVKVFDLKAQSVARTTALVWLRQTNAALISGCQPGLAECAFLRVEGPASSGIALLGNDLTHIARIAECAPEVLAGALLQAGNLDPQATKVMR